ncbi:hypothetical protein LDVICp185 [lymphocystis disease virus-China]|uniref:Uncharacterized protein n=2 Tax=Lymphocystis disease virus 2 TaxID=159183 RepID=A0A6F8X0N1_9VIRU|nr:hypothetical protein LDVICp185 [lymphocystis disease virus-China]AAU11029.1 hypothetical protein [lymphocystis disease virus-China]BCB67524.1 hypothetical protein [Lymphocystis disease virus 2]
MNAPKKPICKQKYNLISVKQELIFTEPNVQCLNYKNKLFSDGFVYAYNLPFKLIFYNYFTDESIKVKVYADEIVLTFILKAQETKTLTFKNKCVCVNFYRKDEFINSFKFICF